MTTLTKEILISKSKGSNFDEIKNVNLWGMKLEDISFVSELKNVETIALSVNEIKSLAPFQHCHKLRELFLRKNQIPSLSEIHYLEKLPCLQTLWLTDNPVTQDENYRISVIAMLPKLNKLDEIDISPSERAEAVEKYKQLQQQKQQQRQASSNQGNIIAAITILLKDLDNEALDVLADQIKILKNQRK